MAPKYDVFISCAGEDKAALGVLIYERFRRRGILAFLDEKEPQVAGDAVKDMEEAMRTALIGLFILSPEFALEPNPMLEVEYFLRRAGLLQDGGEGCTAIRPELVPVFYRLPVAGCKDAEAFEKLECDRVVLERFNERVINGETIVEEVLDHLTLLAGRTGVENNRGATNDDTEEMKKNRETLAENVCDKVTCLLMGKARNSALHDDRNHGVEGRFDEGWREAFDAPKNPKEVLLDFSTATEGGETQTYEAEVLREVLKYESGCQVIALIGEAGVGKSCILREVARQQSVRSCFPGGVYFISLGMDASLDSLNSELLRIVGMSGDKQIVEGLRGEKDTDVILGVFGKLVGRRRSIVLLDDVWERNGITANIGSEVSSKFSNEYGGTVVLTTRSASVACRGDVAIRIDPREAASEVTRNILLNYAKFDMEEIEQEGLGWVIEELQKMSGGLPVWLALTGRRVGKLAVQLRGKRSRAWFRYWEKVRDEGEALLREKIDGYKGLRQSLAVALLVLEENEEVVKERWSYSLTKMYESLCIMKKHTVMPVSVLLRLWKMDSAGAVRIVVEGFSSMGLGEMVFEGDVFKGLKVNDLLHEYAMSLARDKGAIREWHTRLLDAYIPSGNGDVREWWSLAEDEYMHKNVTRHLRNGGCGGGG